MFRNYLTVALRNLVKHKLYSAINIVGLAVGLAACILILLFVRNETTHDRFFTDADRIYQVTMRAQLPGRQEDYVSTVMLPFAEAFKQGFPEVESTARLVRQRSVLQRGDTQFFEDVVIADTTFFRMFDFPFVAGERTAALDDPAGIVLTETMARKYFQDGTAVGQTLTVDGRHTLRVTGVVRDLPSDTHFQFGIVIPYNSVAMRSLRQLETNWGAICCFTYVKFKPGTDITAVQGRLKPWIKQTAPTFNTPQGPIVLGDIFTPGLRNLTAIHTEPLQSDMRPGTSYAEIYIFSAVAALVLAIASINFMSLATARATQRAREVSVRKVVGASRGQIVAQFIGESVLLTGIGLLLALALVELLLPSYSAFLGKTLEFNYGDPTLVGMLLALTLVVGIAGGAYPAFFLSAFNPATVLKGASSGVGGGSGRLRMALVIVQFAISIGLMAATSVVYGQLLYAQNKNLGFEKDNLVVLRGVGAREVRDRQAALVEALRRNPAVAAVDSTDVLPGDGNESNTSIRVAGRPADEVIVIRNAGVGPTFFETMGMRVIAGRAFDRDRGTDIVQRPDWQVAGDPAPENAPPLVMTGAAVLNETAVKRLGFASPEAAVGQEVEAGDAGTLKLTIVGVIEDFHFRSIHAPIAPAFFYSDNTPNGAIAVRLKGGRIPEGLNAVDSTWREFFPNVPIQRAFMDVQIQDMYQRERQTSLLFAAFSGLAIVIACLGLFGLASFTAERRTKEIGLRKVLGAGVTDIVRLLVWQFSKPVLVANLIAWPAAWWGMTRWLEGFTYRIDLTPLPFVGAGMAALAIAWLTVGLHAAKVAQAKPIRALRYE